MATKIQTTLVEHCQVAPPPDTVSEMSLPLTVSDMVWIGLIAPVPRLLFYNIPISKSHFTDVIIPNLKSSLSLALKYFCPLAGNLILPFSDSSWPQIRYSNGDSVPLVFAESNFRDFDYLVSHQPRNCKDFYPLVAKLPPSSSSSGVIKIPLLALQVTLFPEIGICVGIRNHHSAGDGSALYAFTEAWTALSRLGVEGMSLLKSQYLPYYDRDVMKDTKELDGHVWSSMRGKLIKGSLVVDHPQVLPDDIDHVRATFLIGPEDVKRLKDYVSNQRPNIQHLSTFTVVCGYVWSCKVKSGYAVIDTEDNVDEMEYFVAAADCRGRGDPPIPANYFGNCLTFFTARTKSRQLIEKGGFLVAAELIGEAIHETLRNDEGPFKGLEELLESLSGVNSERLCTIAGSPRQNYYKLDFGWGEPRKFESLTIDYGMAVSLGGPTDSGVLEVGLCMPKRKMDAFVTFFEEGLKSFVDICN